MMDILNKIKVSDLCSFLLRLEIFSSMFGVTVWEVPLVSLVTPFIQSCDPRHYIL